LYIQKIKKENIGGIKTIDIIKIGDKIIDF